MEVAWCRIVRLINGVIMESMTVCMYNFQYIAYYSAINPHAQSIIQHISPPSRVPVLF